MCPLMVRWVIELIPHGGPISHSSHYSMTGVTKVMVRYPVSGMMHIKEHLLLIGKSSKCGGSGLRLSPSGPLLYVCRHMTINKICVVT